MILLSLSPSVPYLATPHLSLQKIGYTHIAYFAFPIVVAWKFRRFPWLPSVCVKYGTSTGYFTYPRPSHLWIPLLNYKYFNTTFLPSLPYKTHYWELTYPIIYYLGFFDDNMALLPWLIILLHNGTSFKTRGTSYSRFLHDIICIFIMYYIYIYIYIYIYKPPWFMEHESLQGLSNKPYSEPN